MDIKRSRKLDGEVRVDFDNGWYCAHSITEIGSPDDSAGRLTTMWAWINHLRSKRWWHPQLEERFIREVSKHL